MSSTIHTSASSLASSSTSSTSSSASDVAIPRIPADPALFRDEYASKHRPVVVQGLFEGAPLDRIRTTDDIRRELGQGKVALRGNYMNGMMGQLEAFTSGTISAHDLYTKLVAEEKVAIGDYLDLMARDSARDPFMIYANEQPPPEELMSRLGSLSFFKGLGYEDHVAWENNVERDAKLPPTTMKVVLFMSNKGNCADTHSDWDARHVLNHQMTGRKRFVLFPPEAGVKLNAVESYPTPKLRGMSDRDREALLRYAGGCECILEPGEAVYMPPFWYHHIDYLTDALGVAVRFSGPPQRIIPTMMGDTHRDVYMQNVWARIVREPEKREHVEAVDRIARAVTADYPSRVAKYRAVDAIARELCSAWGIFAEGEESASWITQSDLLQRPLSTAYLKPPGAWGKRKRQWWTVKETSRLAAATLASRVVAMIERRA